MSTEAGRMLTFVAIFIAVTGLVGNAKADFTFGEPVNLGPIVNSGGSDWGSCISSDGLSLYFSSYRTGDWDIWISARSTPDGDWGPPESLGSIVNSSSVDGYPAISVDSRELYFMSDRSGGEGGMDLYVAQRSTQIDRWHEPVNLGPSVNSPDNDSWPSLSRDGLELYFTRGREPEGVEEEYSLYVTRRESREAAWGQPTDLGPVVNGWPRQICPTVSNDGRLLLFCDFWRSSPRPGGFGSSDIWFARLGRDGEWGEPVNAGPLVNTAFMDEAPKISPDGSTLYFASNKCGGSGSDDLWQTPVLPVVDFDADGSVGMSDLTAMIGAWGTDDRLCDIGPMPWGDGVVDEADLEVLMDYWGQGVSIGKPELVAHWTFDEAEGTTAYDSAGTHDANLVGDPIWQPDGGIAAGALEFDGIDDYVDTPFLLDPVNSFSVFAWIQGGGLNQAILVPSQRVVLLQADHLAGNLMTAFMFNADDFLISQTSIIDGQWHHVGLVWDDSVMTKALYVDGVEVAKGTVTMCPWGGSTSLLIGTGDSPFINLWSGLIDDVRVYKGALSPEDVAALAQ